MSSAAITSPEDSTPADTSARGCRWPAPGPASARPARMPRLATPRPSVAVRLRTRDYRVTAPDPAIIEIVLISQSCSPGVTASPPGDDDGPPARRRPAPRRLRAPRALLNDRNRLIEGLPEDVKAEHHARGAPQGRADQRDDCESATGVSGRAGQNGAIGRTRPTNRPTRIVASPWRVNQASTLDQPRLRDTKRGPCSSRNGVPAGGRVHIRSGLRTARTPRSAPPARPRRGGPARPRRRRRSPASRRVTPGPPTRPSRGTPSRPRARTCTARASHPACRPAPRGEGFRSRPLPYTSTSVDSAPPAARVGQPRPLQLRTVSAAIDNPNAIGRTCISSRQHRPGHGASIWVLGSISTPPSNGGRRPAGPARR